MAKVCLECGTPKYRGTVEKGLSHCWPCKRNTHTIEGQARRPLCHDCKSFKIKCQDGVMRPALDYGPEYLTIASCDYGKNTVGNSLARVISPHLVKRDHYCEVFTRHHKSPRDGSPNPLSEEERREWRQFLEMPWAIWLDPKRWDGIVDTHKEKFWDKKERSSPGKTIAMGAALLTGLFLTAKRTKKPEDQNSG